MPIYVMLTLEREDALPDLISTFMDKAVKFSVSKNPNSFCDVCNQGESTGTKDTKKVKQEKPEPDQDKNISRFHQKSRPEIVKNESSTKQVQLNKIPPKKPEVAETFQCQECRGFITKKNLKAHVATHLRIRKLRCTLCSKSFARADRAQIHLATDHKGAPNAVIQHAITDESRKAIDLVMETFFPMPRPQIKDEPGSDQI